VTYVWVKAVLVSLVVGPPIGGLIFGLLISAMKVLEGPGGWEFALGALITAPLLSYIVGLPVAAVAIVLFLLLSWFASRGKAGLAALCGLVSAALLIVLSDSLRPPVGPGLRMSLQDFALQLVAFGTPSAISGWVCWRITRPWHQLS
jgi:hypothetical protein